MSDWTPAQLTALYREQELKQRMRDDGTDPADPGEREAWEDAHPDEAQEYFDQLVTRHPELDPDKAAQLAELDRGPVTRTPPKPDRYGHAMVRDRRRNSMGGLPQIGVHGTPDEPRLYADSPGAVFSGIAVHPSRGDLIRFAREILAFFGEDYGVTLPPWRAASDGQGRRPWFLTRYPAGDDPGIPLEDRHRYSSDGVLIRYASRESAERAARKLNKTEQEARS